MEYLDVKDFFKIYTNIKEIVRSILSGVKQSGKVGEISDNPSGMYAFVEIIYFDCGEELTKNIKIPYSVLSTGNGRQKYIAEQITNFNKPE